MKDAATQQVVNQVTFCLPELPPSTNQTHTISRPNANTNQSRIEIRPEWRRWRSSMQRHVKRLSIAPGSLVRVDLHFYYPFYTKGGQLREVDTQNLLNFAINTVAQKQEWSDKVCKSGTWSSSHDAQRPRFWVRLTEIPQTKGE